MRKFLLCSISIVCLSLCVAAALAGVIVGPFDIHEKATCEPGLPIEFLSITMTPAPPHTNGATIEHVATERHSWPDDACKPCGCVEEQCTHECTLGSEMGPSEYTRTTESEYRYNNGVYTLISGPTVTAMNVTKNSRRVCC